MDKLTLLFNIESIKYCAIEIKVYPNIVLIAFIINKEAKTLSIKDRASEKQIEKLKKIAEKYILVGASVTQYDAYIFHCVVSGFSVSHIYRVSMNICNHNKHPLEKSKAFFVDVKALIPDGFDIKLKDICEERGYKNFIPNIEPFDQPITQFKRLEQIALNHGRFAMRLFNERINIFRAKVQIAYMKGNMSYINSELRKPEKIRHNTSEKKIEKNSQSIFHDMYRDGYQFKIMHGTYSPTSKTYYHSDTGLPDRQFIANGKVLMVEFKGSEGKLRDTQVATHKKIIQAGGYVFTINNEVDFSILIREFFKCS